MSRTLSTPGEVPIRGRLQWAMPLLPVAASGFLLSAMTWLRLDGASPGADHNGVQRFIVGAYDLFGFEPLFMVCVLVLAWSSIWFLTGSVERPVGRLARIAGLGICLAVLINLRADGSIPSGGGELGATLASRMNVVFTPTLSLFVVACAALAALLLATDFFFYRYFDGISRRRSTRLGRDSAVEADAVRAFEELRLEAVAVPEPRSAVPGDAVNSTVQIDRDVATHGVTADELVEHGEASVDVTVDDVTVDVGIMDDDPVDDAAPGADVAAEVTADDSEADVSTLIDLEASARTADQVPIAAWSTDCALDLAPPLLVSEAAIDPSDSDAADVDACDLIDFGSAPIGAASAIAVDEAPWRDAELSTEPSDLADDSIVAGVDPESSEVEAPGARGESVAAFADEVREASELERPDTWSAAELDLSPRTDPRFDSTPDLTQLELFDAAAASGGAEDAADQDVDREPSEPIYEIERSVRSELRDPPRSLASTGVVDVPDADVMPASASSRNAMVDEARELVVEYRRASANFLRRRLRISTEDAMDILQELARHGVIECEPGASQGRVLVESDGR